MEFTLKGILVNIALLALEKVAEDENMREQVNDNFRNFADFIQEKTGKVNVYDVETAIQMAFDSAIKRDKKTMCEILALITTLYATHEVTRGAICGGTLLEKFGDNVFPHINNRELRYAKEIPLKLYNYILNEVELNFEDKVSEFMIKDYADFSKIKPVASSAHRETFIDLVLNPFMKNASKIFKTK